MSDFIDLDNNDVLPTGGVTTQALYAKSAIASGAAAQNGLFADEHPGGLLSALDGVGPENLRIRELLDRTRGGVTEIILALPATVDGQTTAHYLAERLSVSGVSLTMLARGLPIGGELDWLDDGTIAQALRARRPA